MATPPNFNHVSVTVHDLDRSLAFYGGLLDLPVLGEGHKASDELSRIIGLTSGDVQLRWAELGLGADLFLELFEYVDPRGTPVSQRTCDPGSAHFAVTVNGIEHYHRRLVEAGVTVRSEPVRLTSGDWAGAQAFYAVDPDGVTVELIEFPAARSS